MVHQARRRRVTTQSKDTMRRPPPISSKVQLHLLSSSRASSLPHREPTDMSSSYASSSASHHDDDAFDDFMIRGVRLRGGVTAITLVTSSCRCCNSNTQCDTPPLAALNSASSYYTLVFLLALLLATPLAEHKT